MPAERDDRRAPDFLFLAVSGEAFGAFLGRFGAAGSDTLCLGRIWAALGGIWPDFTKTCQNPSCVSGSVLFIAP